MCAGVYVGCMYHEYLDVMVQNGTQPPSQAFVGNGAPYLVGRLSYGFGWTGPCVSTDTACSSSLVAVHLAQKVSPRWPYMGLADVFWETCRPSAEDFVTFQKR